MNWLSGRKWLFIFLFGAVLTAGCRAAPAETAAPTLVATTAPTQTVTITFQPSSTPTVNLIPSLTALPTPVATPVPVAINLANIRQLGEDSDVSLQAGTIILAAAWDHTGEKLAFASDEGLWWASPGDNQLAKQVDIGVFTRALVFHPTQPKLFSGSNDGLVRIWDIQSGALEQVLEANPKGINQLVISPDGNSLATSGNDALIYQWDLASGEAKDSLIGGAFAVPDLAFIPGTNNLVSVDGGVIRVREVDSNRLVISIRTGGPVQAIAVSPDGSRVAAARQGGLVQVWSLESGELVWESSPSAGDEAWSLAFNPAGDLLVSGWRSGLLCWLAADQLDQYGCLPAHERPLGVLSFHPAGHILLTGGYDGWLKFWKISE